MKLSELTAQYITHKQSMGMRFCTEERTPKSFWRAMGNIAITEVQGDRVHAFIAGTGPVTAFWHRKHRVLVGFYRFALARGYVSISPLPKMVPKPPRAFVPHIYSHDELRRLLEATASCDNNSHSNIESDTFRTLILLLYGAGLRISEALALTLADVNLSAGILNIQASKFYKTRLVPLSPDLTCVLSTYATKREIRHPSYPEADFFVSRTGSRLTRRSAEHTFSRLRLRAGVMRRDGARYQPRLHDLRHAFSIHRLIAWYRHGADVQRLLPQLATYLGHVHIAATQRYLTMTPELLPTSGSNTMLGRDQMSNAILLGSWVRRFLLEHLVAERNLARNTQRSYRDTSTVIPYLDKSEMDALLAAPNCQTAQGRRDHALLLFLYNSGVRADEAAQLVVGDLHLGSSYVRVLGKGGKERQCPKIQKQLGAGVRILN